MLVGLGLLIGLEWATLFPLRAATGPGSVDPEFRPELTESRPWAAAMAVDARQRVWVATSSQVIRLLADGRRDPDFTPVETGGAGVVTLAVTAEGKAYLGGTFTTFPGAAGGGVVRVRENGTIDPEFRPAPPFGLRYVNALAPHPNGGVVVGGWFNEWDGLATPEYVRLREDGSLDAAFVTNGVAVDPYSRNSIGTIRVLPGGKFLVGGAAIWRLAADGRVEATFNNAGISGTWGAGADGSVWIAEPRLDSAGQAGVRVRQYPAEGGVQVIWERTYACDGRVWTLEVLADGRLLLGGDFQSFAGGRHAALVRLDRDGEVDDGFVSDLGVPADGGWRGGPLATESPVGVAAILPGDGGRLWVRGTFTNAGAIALPGSLTRLLGGDRPPAAPVLRATRTVETIVEGRPARFGFLVESALPIQGGWTQDGRPLPGVPGSALVLEDLRLADAGSYQFRVTNALGEAVGAEIRLTVTPAPTTPGSVDVTHFALAPVEDPTPVNFGGTIPLRLGARLAPDRRSLYGWTTGGRFLDSRGGGTTNLARWRADGALDATFVARPGPGSNWVSRLVLPLRDGRVLCSGSFAPEAPEVLRRETLLMLRADGSVDPSFTNELVMASRVGRIQSLHETAEGRILVAGAFASGDVTAPWTLVSLLPDGRRDPAFTPLSGLTPYRMANQSGGRVILALPVSELRDGFSQRLARLRPDGSVDDTFRCSAVVDQFVTSLTVDHLDRLLVGVSTPTSGPGGTPILVRLLTDGAADETFRPWRDPVPSRGTVVVGVAEQGDGRCVVALSYSLNPDASAPAAVLRCFADGTLDPEFRAPEFSGEILAAELTADEQVLVVGTFRDLNGTGRSSVVRLNGHDEQRLEALRAEDGGFAARVWTRLGRRYHVETSEFAFAPIWENFGELDGTGGPRTFRGGGIESANYFRLRIEDQRRR